MFSLVLLIVRRQNLSDVPTCYKNGPMIQIYGMIYFKFRLFEVNDLEWILISEEMIVD